MYNILHSFNKPDLVYMGKLFQKNVNMRMKKHTLIHILLERNKQVGGNDSKYGSPSYWDNRYTNSQGNHFDWLFTYDKLKPTIQKYINKNDYIFVPGAGNALLSPDMHKDGYTHQDCIDISPSVVQFMNQKYKDYEGLEYKEKDILHNDIPDNTYDSIIDKSVIDTFYCFPDKIGSVKKMFQEYKRMLKTNGICILVSLHNKNWVRNFIDLNDWNILHAFDEKKITGSTHSVTVIRRSSL